MDEEFKLAREFILLSMNLQNFCENTNDKNLNKNLFSIKFKILMFIQEYGKVSPSILVNNLNIAKSNIAIFCKQLLNEKYIYCEKDEFDHRIIYYCLTSKGENYITNFESLLEGHINLNFEDKQKIELIKATKEINNYLSKTGAK